MKTKVKMTVYKLTQAATTQHTTYEGRLIGLIDSVTFEKLYLDKASRKYIKSHETTPVSTIAKNRNLKGNRLAVIIEKKDNVNQTNKLFISESLGNISWINPDRLKLGIAGTKGSFITIEEME